VRRGAAALPVARLAVLAERAFALQAARGAAALPVARQAVLAGRVFALQAA
jgi:hypothetical protein